MKIYWALKSIPELRDLSSKQRRNISRICFRRSLKNSWKIKGLLLLTGIMAAVGGMVAEAVIPNPAIISDFEGWFWRWLITVPFPLPVLLIFTQEVIKQSRLCYQKIAQEIKT